MPGSLFNKVAGLACNFIKKENLPQVFPVNFAKFLRTPFLQSTSGRLLLKESSKVYISADIIMNLEDVTTSFPSAAMIQHTPFFYKQSKFKQSP